MSQVLLIGAGDMGERFAMGLAASGRVRELVLVDVAGSGLREKAAALVSSCDVRVRAVEAEPRDQYSFERLLRDLAPDLVIQAAALQSPWALIGRDDPVGPRPQLGRPVDPPAVPAAVPARRDARGARDRVRRAPSRTSRCPTSRIRSSTATA